MPRNLLLDLPREIREQIYIYTLFSPTGILCPDRPPNTANLFAFQIFESPYYDSYNLTLSLSLLQTCKQINAEAKDVIYKHNAFAVQNFDELPQLSRHVEHIFLSIELEYREDLENTAEALDVLSRRENLTTLTLFTCKGFCEMNSLMELRLFGERPIFRWGEVNPHAGEKLFDEYLTVLRNSWGKYDGQWAGVARKLFLQVESVNPGPGDAKKVVEDMHDAFKGELWIDDRLCYKDGQEVLQAFEYCDLIKGPQIVWSGKVHPVGGKMGKISSPDESLQLS
jgi:hypothetical protein